MPNSKHNTAPIRLLIHGAHGRMGSRIAAMAEEDERFIVAGAVDRDTGSAATLDALQQGEIDAIIDFSSVEGAAVAADLSLRLGCALLVGTTGLSDAALRRIDAAAERAAVMLAANTSLGVAVLRHLVAEAARLLGDEFNVDLIEWHHAAKRDAPSGTALRLADALRHGGAKLTDDRIHCIRAGDIVGEHVIEFAGPGERIALSHRATSRDLFVRGALRAAAWLAGRAPGRYSIEQSLGQRT